MQQEPNAQSAIATFDGSGLGGSVRFDAAPEGTLVTFDLAGFAPKAIHAIHVHELGDTSRGCESLGGHLNPAGVRHGSVLAGDPPSSRHAGDLINNLRADDLGRFQFAYVDPLLRVDGSAWGVLGRSVVIHAGVDDLGRGEGPDSLTTGSAGGRMACAVIGRAATPKPNYASPPHAPEDWWRRCH
jgi:Cu/Zn superoxide dismutase